MQGRGSEIPAVAQAALREKPIRHAKCQKAMNAVYPRSWPSVVHARARHGMRDAAIYLEAASLASAAFALALAALW